MALRLIAGLVLAATLSGCFGSSGSGAAGGTSSTASGSITSTPTSTGPAATPLILSGVPAASVVEGSEYSFTPTVTAATSAITFAVSGLPSWATFDSSTGTLSGIPSSAAIGTTGDITITATDGTSLGSVGPFVIRIDAEAPPATAGVPPTITGTPATAVTSGQTYAFQPAATDAAGRPLTFAVTNCPVWATFSTATGKLSGVPSAAQAGSYSNITIRVTDGTLSASLPVFTVVVTAAMTDMPVIKGTATVSVVAGQAYSFQPTASDPAGKPLTFSIMHPPVWAAFSSATGKLSGTPTAAQVGTYSAIVIAADNGVQMSSLPAFAIQVTPAPTAAPPAAPTLSGNPATSVAAGTGYSFTPTHTDPSGGPLVFSIGNAPTWATFNAATGQLSGTPSASDVGTTSGITISVSDGTSQATLPAFSIVVAAPATNGSATLSWTAPTQNTNGTPLTDLAGYRIYYGNSSGAMTQTVQITDPSVVTATIANLSSGTWYFEVTAYNSASIDSSATAAASKTID